MQYAIYSEGCRYTEKDCRFGKRRNARGDYSPESDLDIMLLMNCGHSDVKKFQGVVCKIASRIGLEDDIEVSMTMQDKNTFERRLAILPFYRNVKKEGVTLYES